MKREEREYGKPKGKQDVLEEQWGANEPVHKRQELRTNYIIGKRRWRVGGKNILMIL